MIATTIDRQEHSHESEARCTSTLAEYLAFAKAHPEQFVNPSEGGFTILQGENEIHEVEVFMAQKLQAKGLPTEWSQVGIVYPDTGMTSACDELFFAEVESYGSAEIGEAISEILPTPVPEFERMIRDNEISDGYTLAAYTRARLKDLL